MKPIRVAFSGSGFRVPAHVGAILAIRDAGYQPVEYAGTSGGSIVAGLAACGMDADAMADLVLHMDWSGLMSWSPLNIFGKGWCDGSALLAWLTKYSAGKAFADLPVDLTIMASNINNKAPFRFARDATPTASVATAMRASAAIPFVYEPVVFEGITLSDGGMGNNLPVMRLAKDDIPRLGVELTSKEQPWPAGYKPTMLELAQRDIELMLASNESTQVLMGVASGASIAYVETGYANSLDKSMSVDMRERLMHDGYQAVTQTLATLET